ncbi:TetR/AcrR family transcriptional regulator [Paenibacillus sp. TRM 82003]|uniref:TetR/AcrR family transcriptional regulator n=1 Tax=Kineococcus sp. TRM81007 TaxID=2925831 RepID=UPI001F57F73E|nr:TetR/AcrR family transcriptional regulator [Kineococcus sp. TRM81007]MCI2237000.1 TetR/AcrR family transcriptional regulator [Kineococcus sp. TRM81007]MCI3926605.1 TetR/AcrR family transcriptional regulator [Paenibacillus sp. TRM 82003]
METEIDWTPGARSVLDAASELFYARGLHAVGVEAIAERAGVTKKTLYDRFGSKDRLVVEYLAARDRRWRALLTERIEAAGPGAEQRLTALFAASHEWSRAEGSRGCAMVNAHAEIDDPAHPARALVVEQKRWMLGLFRDVAERAGVPAPHGAAKAVALLHEGALVSYGTGAFEGVFEAAQEAALLLIGGARPRRLPSSDGRTGAGAGRDGGAR